MATHAGVFSKNEIRWLTKMTTYILSTLAWSVAIKRDIAWQQRNGRLAICSTANAGVLAAVGVVQLWACIRDEFHPLSEMTIPFAIGYYAADFVHCALLMRIHHIVTIAVFLTTPHYPMFVASLLLLEVPVPFLNFALWFRSRRLPVPRALKIAVVVSYFIARVVVFPVTLVVYIGALYQLHPLLPVPYIAIALLGMKWFREIVSRC